MIEQCKELKPLPGSKSRELLGNPDRGFQYELAVHVAEDEQEYGISDCNTSAIERAKEQFELYKDDRPQMAQVYVYMHSYMERDLDEAAFKAMRRYFDLLKEKKIRMLLRFAYQRDKIEWAKGDVDPHLNQVLRHIDQLKPLIEQYKDNIYAVQAGFVGIWGEWHSMINLSKEDCKIILEKLIDALPPELFVQIRYMWIKNMLRVDDPRRLRVGYHDDYVMDRPISWSSAANETEWAVETAESPYLVNDAEMPWGDDEEFMGPLMNPIPLMQRMYRHCFSTLSIRHNYIERGCEYDMLVVKNDGTPLISNWWNGFSASLDFANPFAVKWFDKKLKNLIYKYNIDGFKFDGGDASYYMHENINGNLALNRYGNYGANFSYNEFRTSFQNAGKPIAQRFVNVYHEWDSWGINQMIPAAIAQGVLGYAFTCPDMVGGGDNSRLADSSDLEMVDEELFVRSAEVCALMPMMQFCASPWKKLRPQNAAICRKMAELHNEYADVILELVENASVTGEPIIRALDYVFPNQNLVKITDQFMLGNEIMVAPVIEEGARKRTVKLPQGRWKYHDRIIHGGKTMEISVPLDELPIFTLVSSDN